MAASIVHRVAGAGLSFFAGADPDFAVPLAADLSADLACGGGAGAGSGGDVGAAPRVGWPLPSLAAADCPVGSGL